MSTVFEADGWDARTRVGLLVPDGDIGPESEWSAMRPTGVSVFDGRQVVTTGQAMLAAVSHFDAGRVMLVDPPWFPAGLTDLGRRWLESKGVNVVRAVAADLPSGQGNIHPGGLHRWMCSAVRDVDLVLIGGNGFRAIGAVRATEADTGVPIVTANTALLWHTLRALGRPTNEITRYGRLFTPAAEGRGD